MTANGILLTGPLFDVMRLDILVWVAGIPIVLAAMVALYLQWRQYRRLTRELRHLAKVKHHTIEHDLVLKAMKLAIWRIDIQNSTINFETDYRDATGTAQLPPNIPLDVVLKMMPPQYEKKFHKAIDDFTEGRIDDYHGQYEIRPASNDRVYWCELFATVEKRDLDGRPVTVVGTSANIDRQKESEQALIEARNHAEESDRLKTAFLANISHEIRTPLNAIVGFSDILPVVQDDAEREEIIKLIKQNNAHLLRLFDDIVNMSKLEAGGSAIKRTSFSIRALLAEVSLKYEGQAAEKHLSLTIATGSDIELYTDRDRLRQILCQYLDNAIKFTDSGAVTLGADVEDDRLKVWVRDTGKGIPPEHCNDHLFERFVKVDDFVAGTGLGLSICRSLAVSMGARVGMESTLGHGSRFWVEMSIV